MGISRKEDFPDDQNRIADLAKGLAHPARVAILDLLHDMGEASVSDFARTLPLSQPTLSQHVREMREAGLISGKTAGRSVLYQIDQASMAPLLAYLVRNLSKKQP